MKPRIESILGGALLAAAVAILLIQQSNRSETGGRGGGACCPLLSGVGVLAGNSAAMAQSTNNKAGLRSSESITNR